MPFYAYRYQTFKEKVATTHVTITTNYRIAEIIKLEGSCTAYARHLKHGTTRVKPRNLLEIPDKYFSMPLSTGFGAYYRFLDSFAETLTLIPWTTDLSTVNLDDYPELFI